MKLLLEREPSTAFCTMGRLYVDGNLQCFTLEDVVRPVKIPGETAIPAGTYQVTIDWSMRFKTFLPRICQVPDFVGVRIHPGNTAADTEGCILVGKYHDNNVITHSRDAFLELFPKMKEAFEHGQTITLTIENAPSARDAQADGIKQ
jgi:hypothetical protein